MRLRSVRRYCQCGHRLGRYFGHLNDQDTRYDGRGRVTSDYWWWVCPLRIWPWGGGREHVAQKINESGPRRRIRAKGFVRGNDLDIHAGAWRLAR